MRDSTAVPAAAWLLVTALACGGSEDAAAPHARPSASPRDGEAPGAVASAVPAPGGSAFSAAAAQAGPRAPEPGPPEPGPPEAAPPEPAPPTMASIRAEAEHDPAGFTGKPVALDVLYVRISQRMYGYSTQHAGGTIPVLHVAFPGAPDDTMACQMNNHQWPPAGVTIGDTIHVEGVWSFDRMLQGGTAEGGGPLEIHGCKVSKPAVPGPTVLPRPAAPKPAAPTSDW